MRRPCLHPGCPHLTDGQARCAQHERHQTTEWRTTSRAAISQWRTIHGDWCPGNGGHPTPDLTVHHTDNPNQPYAVLCRSCNSSQG